MKLDLFPTRNFELNLGPFSPPLALAEGGAAAFSFDLLFFQNLLPLAVIFAAYLWVMYVWNQIRTGRIQMKGMRILLPLIILSQASNSSGLENLSETASTRIRMETNKDAAETQMDERRKKRLSDEVIQENEELRKKGFGLRRGRPSTDELAYREWLEKELKKRLNQEEGKDVEEFVKGLIRLKEGSRMRLERDGFPAGGGEEYSFIGPRGRRGRFGVGVEKIPGGV